MTGQAGEGPRWLLRCNGRLPGAVVGASDAAWCLEQPGAEGTLDTEVRWRSRGTQDPRAQEREFSLRPLPAEQYEAWKLGQL